jgi:hypothetical protein
VACITRIGADRQLLVPLTVMRFPRIVKDCPYLYEKLKPISQNTTYEPFAAVFGKTVRPELVHSFNENDR